MGGYAGDNTKLTAPRHRELAQMVPLQRIDHVQPYPLRNGPFRPDHIHRLAKETKRSHEGNPGEEWETRERVGKGGGWN